MIGVVLLEGLSNVTETIIQTINTIFEKLFSSIDNNLYSVLDEITFIGPDILKDKNFEKIFGTSASNGFLLIVNSLLLGIILYYAIKLFLSNITYSQTLERPYQFIFKLFIYGICMNFSFFLIDVFLSINYNATMSICQLGKELFGKEICFSELISAINTTLAFNTNSIDIFSLDGMIKGTLTVSLLNLVFTYAFRYIMIKVFVLLSPLAILSLALENFSWFFKSWLRNLFSLLFIQLIVSIVLVILFSMNYSSANLLYKFVYVGGIYALIKANSFVREFIGGISTTVSQNVYNFRKVR